MTSPKQIDANRRNALHSTGPRTPEGKAVVGQNPARHGLYAASPDDATEPERPRSSSPASSPAIDYEAADRWLSAHPLADER